MRKFSLNSLIKVLFNFKAECTKKPGLEKNRKSLRILIILKKMGAL